MGFEFLTIVRNGPDSTSLYRLAVDEELREEMARAFTVPVSKWQDPTIARVEFDQDYKLSDVEIFEIKKFVIPPDLLNAARFPQQVDSFDAKVHGVADIKGIVAVNMDGENAIMVFKATGKAKKIEPAKNLMLVCGKNEYAKMTTPGIILDDKVAAFYDDGCLIFRSPATVKQMLSLKDYMKDASDLEIVSLLEANFDTDAEKVLGVLDPWMRKRFSALIQNDLFGKMSVLEIHEAAKEFSTDIPLELSKDRTKFIMPQDRRDIKMMLKFLNEEYYRGSLTGKDYQTSSKRPLERPQNYGGMPQKQGLQFPG